MNASFAAILFDLDGVLVDTEAVITRLWADIFAGHDLHFTPEEITRLTSGQRFEGVLEQLETQRGWKAPEDFLPMLDQRFTEACDHVPLIEGAAQTLSALHAAGVPFAVASNSQRNRLHLKLQGAGLANYVKGRAFSPEDVGRRGKPQPDLYLHAAQQLGVPTEHCLVVEDSAPGARAGLAAGATVWGLMAGGHILPEDRQKLLDLGVSRLVSSHAELRTSLGC